MPTASISGERDMRSDCWFQTTPWPKIAGQATRLGMGTANSAGQLGEFARALSMADGDFAAEVVMTVPTAWREYQADICLAPPVQRDPTFQRRQVRRVSQDYTHLLVDAFRPILGWRNGRHLEDDLPELSAIGIPLALLCHGSEVRSPKRHLYRHEFSLFHSAPAGKVESLTQLAERNHRVLEEVSSPVFVTTPDLLDDLPHATWTPLVVDVDYWHCARSVMRRSVPVVLHAPSLRWTKGTDAALPLLQDLHDRGRIELRLLEGVPHSAIRSAVWDSDIVVDQLSIGSYGAFACESMAAGKPVIAYLGDTCVEQCGPDLPVVNASPATLGEVLESLLDDRRRAMRIGRRSIRYVRTMHDGSLTAARIRDAFLSRRA